MTAVVYFERPYLRSTTSTDGWMYELARLGSVRSAWPKIKRMAATNAIAAPLTSLTIFQTAVHTVGAVSRKIAVNDVYARSMFFNSRSSKRGFSGGHSSGGRPAARSERL